MNASIKSWAPRLAALTSVAAVLGCGGANAKYDANVQGTVTIDGELAPGGSVTFTPVENGPTGVGTIAADGSYSLRIGQGDVGSPDSSVIPAGEYVVTAMITGPSPKDATSSGGPPPAGPKLIADKYGSRATSDLKFEVKKGPNIIVLKLDGPWANPPAEEEDKGGDEVATLSTADEGTEEPTSADTADESNSAGAATETDGNSEAAAKAEIAPVEEAKP
ncbi:hypothetical protein [Lacipirellula limnantheis]|uniref:Carboxypeptidase regulatory-like domain-containing protein n=1 Tax=Lacipirellula limnantheis TaxID=2528024 RepID=A0A517TZT7_9BACT|nr:hypothetical protein [Lacipirellula limnantheis]QDT73881.1 hypothetical protein I41_30720 [Lacipirellula limnantheis]